MKNMEQNELGKRNKVEQNNKTKMVTVRLFKDNHEYKDDVFIGVNGKTWLIQRGVEVEVPDYVAEVLSNSQKQDEAAALMIERETDKYSEKA